MRLLGAALVALVLAGAAPARADAGSTLNDSAREASLAGAMTGRAGDLSSIHGNPAGLAGLRTSEVALYGSAGRFRLDFARTGEPGQRTDRLVAGYGVSLGVRLPGPDWLQRFRVGVSLALPAEHILRVRAPSRADAPLPALYDARIERTALTASVAVELPGHVSLGVGVTIAPSLWAPTTVTYDPARGSTPDEGVIVSLDREVRFEGAFLAGARVQPVPELAIGLAYHQAVVTRAHGPSDLSAGPVHAGDPIDFTLFYEPDQWSVGALFEPTPELSISVDGTWARWSSYRTLHSAVPDPPFHDVVLVRAGIEWRARPFFAWRIGYGLEPTPVPAQVASTTLLDADRHVLATGLGLDLGPLAGWPVRIDLYGRLHAIGAVSAERDRSRLPDADPSTPGQQITDLGYPSFGARLGLFQLGLTVTVVLGRPARAP